MLIPIGDINPARRTPWVMRALILANVGIFLGVQPWDACGQQQFFLQWAAIPAEMLGMSPLSGEQVAELASPAGCRLSAVGDKPVYLAAMFSMFFHADLLHLGGNMLFLWVFGNNIEDRFGHGQFLLLYLLFGVIATVVFVITAPASVRPLVGASGAVAGVLGSYLVLFPTARVTVVVVPLIFLAFQLPALLVLGAWFLLQFREAGGEGVAGGGGVAYSAHVAGFIAGVVITLLSGGRPQRRRRRQAPPPPPSWQ